MNSRNNTSQIDLAAIRERLQRERGRQLWRSLDELAATPEFEALLHDEFPQGAVEFSNSVNRRDFIKLMGASLALAGITSCTRQPEERIVPYVQAPEHDIPGKPLYFATAATHEGYARGVLVESHAGRPTKIEGNPEHPMSLGATDARTQASILSLYDPDRSQVIKRAGRFSTWDAFLTELNAALAAQRLKNGAGLRLLTGTITSPTLAHQFSKLMVQLPAAKWHQYDAAGRHGARAGARLAFGEYLETHYDLEQADVILSLDADFLTSQPGSLRVAKSFAARRRVEEVKKMNRLYALECTPTLSGTLADHRLPLAVGEIENFTLALAKELGIVSTAVELPEPSRAWLPVVRRDLENHRGRSLVIAGENQSPVVHAVVHAINHALGNTGATVHYTPTAAASPVDQEQSLPELVADMNAGAVDLLIMLGSNPVYNAPADLDFAQSLSKVALRVHSGLYDDETSAYCHWHIPATHYLEQWSDARAFDGTVTIVQPLIAPLYGGKSQHEVLAVLSGDAGKTSHELVKNYWQSQRADENFDVFWQTTLHDGVMHDTAFAPKTLAPRIDESWLQPRGSDGDLEVVFRPDATVWDGAHANNGWLQELPKPFTRLTWENAALISPALAERQNLANEEVVTIRYQGRELEAPVWIVPGQAENTITLHLGYGRTRAGKIGDRLGFNAYAIRTSAALWNARGVEISKTGKRQRLATTQLHHNMENRHLVREAAVDDYRAHPHIIKAMGHDPDPALTLYPGFKYEGYAWGMAIDLNACTGCSACVVACQAENNIPIVGKQEVINGRELHWIRIDRYYEGGLDNPATLQQPVMCMHCENAPCEVVCPVAATTHSSEGLNEMTYNRCVGTRYCANNCPYKVRRFNFYRYADYATESLKLQRNPDVTVRHRGVMEKCTYCVQRISEARIEAKKADRDIRDGDVVTACQQVCPTEAIAFGNINDPNSRVAKLKASQREYGLLTDLNTRPRTTYLARITNPSPELTELENGV